MSEPRDATTSQPGANAPGLLETIQYLSTEAGALGKEFFALIASEVSLAAKSLPKLIGTVFAALFFAVTSWLSVCAAIAYGIFALTELGWLGFVTFAALQCAALYACKVFISKYAHYLSLPYSRQYFNDLKRGHDEPTREAA